METHENIIRFREKLGLSQEALAEMVGYKDRSSVAKVEAGKVDLSQSKIAAFAKALNVTPAQLMGLDTTPTNIIPVPRTSQIPLIGTIACGTPLLAAENLEEMVDLPEHIRADFALRCKGDSMITARIFDGDIVYIRRQPQVDNGKIAAVRVGEEATLKKILYFPNEHRLVLRPCNPLYSDMVYTGEELSNIEVLGEAVAFTSLIRHE